ncbi:MAG: hypothetical protein NTX87_18780 [Planctomycetota bacterium]|nr:hypothetical protein [Planctomycetota bacterium]
MEPPSGYRPTARGAVQNTADAAENGEQPPDDDQAPGLPAMECQPFEHYDYLMLMFRHEQDFQRACEVLGIKKVEVTYPGGLKKIGLGRVIDGAKAIEKLAGGSGQ